MKIIISGAGVAGPAAAFWLSKQGHECTVIERFPSLREAGLQVDLRGQAIEVVRRMDLLETVRVRSVQELGTMLVDSKGQEKVTQRRNHLEQERGQGMTSAYEIMRRDLIEILYDATKDDAAYRFGVSVSHYKDEGDQVTLTLSDGTTETCDLLIAADGQGSRIRKQMFLYTPEQDRSRWLGVFSAYYTLPRRDYDTSFARMYHATGRRFAMTRWHTKETGQVYLMAMSHEETFRRALERGDNAGQRDAFLSVFRGMGWQEDRLLHALRDADDFYADEMLQRNSEVWSRGRVVLLGDSAYCASPVAGVGASMALVGAYVLAGELATYSGGNDSGEEKDVKAALASYERVMRPLAEASQKLPRGSLHSWLPLSSLGVWSLHAVERMKNVSRGLGFLQPWAGREARRDGGEWWRLPDYPEMCWRHSFSTSSGGSLRAGSAWSPLQSVSTRSSTAGDGMWLPSHGPRGGSKAGEEVAGRPSTVGSARIGRAL